MTVSFFEFFSFSRLSAFKCVGLSGFLFSVFNLKKKLIFADNLERKKEMIFLVSLLLYCQASNSAYVATPFGFRLEECVLSVPSGSRVRETESGTVSVMSINGDFEAFEYVPPASCHDEVSWSNVGNYTKDCDQTPCTCDSLPCNNWINNAGYFPRDKKIAGFSSVYTVPENPTGLSGGGQTLFYFIGAENTDGLPRHGQNGVGRTILQPVLTWAPSNWCRNGTETGWCMSSWNCCPANITVHTPYIFNIKSGEKLLGYFNKTANEDSYIVSSSRLDDSANAQVLSVSGGNRTFNWADVTLEVYSIEACDQFAPGEMIFSDLKMWDTNYESMIDENTPWLLTSPRPCGGTIEKRRTKRRSDQSDAADYDFIISYDGATEIP